MAARITFYLDEHVHPAVAAGLRVRGVDVLTVQEYRKFSKSYDLEILDAIKGRSWFTVLHLHRNALWDEVLDYPVEGFNFPDFGDNSVTLAAARAMTNKALVSGLPSGQSSAGVFDSGTPGDIDAMVKSAWQQVDMGVNR